MEHVELSPDSVMTVEGVLYSDYIPPLKTYGPLRKCSIKVSDIVNLINNDIKVLLRDDQAENLYFFVKQYNYYIGQTDPSAPKALRCEEVLYERVYGMALKQEKMENKENPFVADDEEDISLAAETISLQSNGTADKNMKDPLKFLKKKNTFKRPHAYDIFNSKDNTQSFTQQLDDVNMFDQYGLTDFDVE